MADEWKNLICKDCWHKDHPNELLAHIAATATDPPEPCCFCGVPTNSGIYVREDRNHTACDLQTDVHKEEELTATVPEKESWGSAEKAVLPEGKSGLFVLDGSGDSRFMWSKDNPDEISAAKSTFERLKEKGYDAFTVRADGSKGEKVAAFNPDAEKIIMAPRMVGG